MASFRRKRLGLTLVIAGAALLSGVMLSSALGVPLLGSAGSGSASPAIRVLGTINVGHTPDGLVYDPVNNEVYVANGGQSSVYAFNASTDVLLNTISVKPGPGPMVFDPANNETYVADSKVSSVSVIPSNNGAPTTLTVGSIPNYLLYDPANKEVYVSVYSTSQVVAINSSTNALTKISGFSNPQCLLYDPANNRVYVEDYGNNTLAVVSHNKIVAWLATDVIDNWGNSYPDQLAYDPANQTIWVVSNSGLVDVFNGSGALVEQAPSLGNGASIVFDPHTGQMYIADNGNSQVSIVNASTYSVLNVGTDYNPTNLLYDPVDHLVYVTNYEQTAVTAFQYASGVVTLTIVQAQTNPDSILYNPVQTAIWEANQGSNTITVISG